MASPPPQSCNQPGTITISWVAPTPAPVGYEVRYRKVTSPESGWNTAAAASSPYVAPADMCYDYEYEVRSDCGSLVYSDWVPSVVSRPQGQVYISTTAPGITITNVTGITGYTFIGPLLAGSVLQSEGGLHDGGAFSIGVTFSGTALIASNIRLYKNEILQQCVNIPQGTGTSFTFNNVSFLLTDELKISMGTGSC
jgi:hypothetical protein